MCLQRPAHHRVAGHHVGGGDLAGHPGRGAVAGRRREVGRADGGTGPGAVDRSARTRTPPRPWPPGQPPAGRPPGKPGRFRSSARHSWAFSVPTSAWLAAPPGPPTGQVTGARWASPRAAAAAAAISPSRSTGGLVLRAFPGQPPDYSRNWLGCFYWCASQAPVTPLRRMAKRPSRVGSPAPFDRAGGRAVRRFARAFRWRAPRRAQPRRAARRGPCAQPVPGVARGHPARRPLPRRPRPAPVPASSGERRALHPTGGRSPLVPRTRRGSPADSSRPAWPWSAWPRSAWPRAAGAGVPGLGSSGAGDAAGAWSPGRSASSGERREGGTRLFSPMRKPPGGVSGTPSTALQRSTRRVTFQATSRTVTR